MRVRNSPARLTHAANDNDFALLLEKTRTALGTPEKDFCFLIGVSTDQYSKIIRREAEIPIQAATNFCQRFDLSLESLQRNTLDLGVLVQRSRGMRGTLPKVYATGAFSRRRFGVVLFDWMEKYLGLYAKTEVMRHFQVDDQTFSEEDAPISIRFFEDATFYAARRFGVRAEEFSLAGMLSYEHLRDTPMGRAASRWQSAVQIHERFAGELQPFLERNFDFKLMRLGGGICSTHVTARTDVLDALKTKRIGNAYTCAWKRGLFAVMPRFLGQGAAPVKETRCVHLGDPYCRFEMDYSSKKNAI